jgi:hypothetical protein
LNFNFNKCLFFYIYKIFGLKLFRESVAGFTKGKKATDGSDIDVQIPNELSLLEARKFLDEIGITKN